MAAQYIFPLSILVMVIAHVLMAFPLGIQAEQKTRQVSLYRLENP